MTHRSLNEVYVVDAVRTPIGKIRGSLSRTRPDDLAAHTLNALLVRQPKIALQSIDEVILGCANQAGEDNRNVARMALLIAGWPDSIPAMTVNRLCASGLEAVASGMRMIQCAHHEIVVAGGVESMTRAPWSLPKPIEGFASGKIEAYDTSLGWRYPNPRLEARFKLESMGETAENIATLKNISRDAQDAWALRSHQRAISALEQGFFTAETIHVPLDKGGVFSADECPRKDTSLDKLMQLKPLFRQPGTVTAGNASPMNDGASALLLASLAALQRYQLTPIARLIDSASVGLDPRYMGLGPIAAIEKLLKNTQHNQNAIDLFEINEAFAVQVLACQQALAIDPDRLNVQGGGIALGHPLGASGARILTTLIYALRRQKKRLGVASLCVGVGQGMALMVEAL